MVNLKSTNLMCIAKQMPKVIIFELFCEVRATAEEVAIYIDLFGKLLSEKYLKGISFIIKMVIDKTIVSPISS